MTANEMTTTSGTKTNGNDPACVLAPLVHQCMGFAPHIGAHTLRSGTHIMEGDSGRPGRKPTGVSVDTALPSLESRESKKATFSL